MLKFRKINPQVKCSSFSVSGGTSEHFIIAHSRKNIAFQEALAELLDNYRACLQELGLTEETQAFSRFYLSDIANQNDALLASDILDRCARGAFAVIQQCPLNGSGVSLLAYHIKYSEPVKRVVTALDNRGWRNTLKISAPNYDLLWSGNFSGFGQLDSRRQSDEIFSSYNQLINDHGMTLLKNTVRTWIYVRDIDNHYMGMVKSRVDYFDEQGLNKSTRYIASTGIEAKLDQVNSLVAMDALSISNLKKEQIIRMEALDMLSPTHLYGVTFERGCRVDFGDRSHFHISGTASIDADGEVVHPGDVSKQAMRVLRNVNALLESQGASLADMTHFIVYLRNITDVDKVTHVLSEVISDDTPMIFVEGTVCRPGWLVEIEGVGIRQATLDYPNF